MERDTEKRKNIDTCNQKTIGKNCDQLSHTNKKRLKFGKSPKIKCAI